MKYIFFITCIFFISSCTPKIILKDFERQCENSSNSNDCKMRKEKEWKSLSSREQRLYYYRLECSNIGYKENTLPFANCVQENFMKPKDNITCVQSYNVLQCF